MAPPRHVDHSDYPPTQFVEQTLFCDSRVKFGQRHASTVIDRTEHRGSFLHTLTYEKIRCPIDNYPPAFAGGQSATVRNALGKYLIKSLAISDTSPSSAAPRSPAKPCTCTASRAASKGFNPCPNSAVVMPVSTSPLPPVAMPGLPVLLWACCRPSVTSV